MGTDIHLYVEDKPVNNWVYVAGPLFVWRDYGVFSRLCGIRKGDHWYGISETPRGLPDSLSPIVSEEIAGPDFHSHSWISGQEFIREFPWQTRLEDMPHFAVVCYAFMWRAIYPTRFIFAFDN